MDNSKQNLNIVFIASAASIHSIRWIKFFANKNKAAKNLMSAGITPEAYAEIAINAKHAWQDLESQLDEDQGGQMAEYFIDQIDGLLENDKEMSKAILKAYKEMIQEMEDAARQKQAGL